MALLVAGVVLCVVVVVGSGVEWGRLLVNGRLVVIEDGLSLWQGVVVLIAAAAGALAMALSVAASRGRPAALAALASGVVITVVSIQALVYVVPPIESVLGPGGWMALAAGILLLMLGLVALVVPAWRGRTGATRSSG
jgi:hypothetical protein